MAKKRNEISFVRSSAAEYLTFLTATGKSGVNAIYADENVWLSQKMMGVPYDVESHTVTCHLQKAFKTGEIDESSVTRIFRLTANVGTISVVIAKQHAEAEFEKYRAKQGRLLIEDGGERRE